MVVMLSRRADPLAKSLKEGGTGHASHPNNFAGFCFLHGLG